MFEKSFVSSLSKNLECAGMSIKAETYLQKALMVSLTLGLFSWLALVLAFNKLWEGLALGLTLSLACLTLGIYFPVAKKKKKAGLMEKKLPFALMQLAVELDLGLAFEQALENIVQADYGLLSQEFNKAIKEVEESGASMQEALLHLSERIDSLNLKRAIAQLVNAYEQGSKSRAGEAVKKIAQEQLAKQKALAKEFSGKIVMLSLMFIMVSAVAPALFLAFIIVGSTFLDLIFTPAQTLLISCLGFPLADISIFYFIKFKTPEFLK